MHWTQWFSQTKIAIWISNQCIVSRSFPTNSYYFIFPLLFYGGFQSHVTALLIRFVEHWVQLNEQIYRKGAQRPSNIFLLKMSGKYHYYLEKILSLWKNGSAEPADDQQREQLILELTFGCNKGQSKMGSLSPSFCIVSYGPKLFGMKKMQ